MAIDDVTLDMLLRGKARLAFFKKDGSVREMIGTTNLEYVPTEQHPKGGSVYSASVQKVYDLGLNEWRSFIKSNLMRIEKYEERK